MLLDKTGIGGASGWRQRQGLTVVEARPVVRNNQIAHAPPVVIHPFPRNCAYWIDMLSDCYSLFPEVDHGTLKAESK